MRKVINFIKGTYQLIKNTLIFAKEHPFQFIFRSFLAGIGAFLLFILSIYIGVFGKLPDEEYLRNIQNPETSSFYDENGKLMGSYFLQNRSNIEAHQLKDDIKNALIATEDARFYEHSGIDFQSFGRVFVKSIILRQHAGGGSTITQQVVKNLFGREQHRFLSTPINKIKEMIIANKIEGIYSKDDILLMYFNTVTFGEDIYGLKKASKRFFNKTPENLNLSESALLVGLLKATSYYNPRSNPERAVERRNVVLDQMVKYNYISQAEADAAKIPLKLNYVPEEKVSSYSNYFKEYLETEFNAWAAQNPAPDGHIYNLQSDGLKIYTTINPTIQKAAQLSLVDQVNRLQKLMHDNWKASTTDGGKEALIKKILSEHAEIKNMKARGASDTEIKKYIAEKRGRKYWEIGEGYVEKEMSLQDSVVRSITRLHAGVVAMNSKNGSILGYVGGIDYGYSQTDQVSFKRPMGSTFKPITYLAALEAGEEPCSFYDNELKKYPEFDDWQPKNADAQYGGSYSMHGALAKSVNTVSVVLQLKVGNENVKRQALKMGIDPRLRAVPSMVLGTSELSLLNMTQAYCAIANGGHRVKPHAIAKIVDKNGYTIYYAKNQTYGRVASEKSVKTMQKMLEGVVNHGTASRFRSYGINKNIIGKTGTTQNNRDGLFIACSPELTVGSWVGPIDVRVQFSSTSMGSGANTALPIVAGVYHYVNNWKSNYLTNFSFNTSYFPCADYSYSRASIAYVNAKNDTMFVRNLLIRDSIARAERKEKEREKKMLDSILKASQTASPSPTKSNSTVKTPTTKTVSTVKQTNTKK